MGLVDDISAIKAQLVAILNGAVGSGIERINPNDMAVITDAIKDLAEAEESCHEAEYYKSVVKAMNEGSSEEMYYRPMRMGYNPNLYANDTTSPYMDNRWRMDDTMANRYGRAYSEYRKARRNYTDTHNETDKADMDTMATRYLANATNSIQDMWNEADAELKMKIKSDLTKLVSTMNV